jgi:ubiquinone/menaquinone biosynthesis C-methylase UbiE
MTLVGPSQLTPADPLLLDLCRRAPRLYALLDPQRLAADAPQVPVDFESGKAGGRGDSYRDAQRDPYVRGNGILALFRLASPDGTLDSWRPEHVVLDVLGGDGTLARAVSRLLPAASIPTVLTSDLSAGMVLAAQRHGLAALRQPAQALRLRDRAVDAVLLAYGTHHIPVDERPVAVAEALRVLRPGGRLVLHDFAESSPAADWFSHAVDPFSRTGHRYPHFTAEQMRQLLINAGYVDVTVGPLYDPFVFTAATPQAARHALGAHLWQMYGLTRLGDNPEAAATTVADLAAAYFRYPDGELAPGQPVREISYRPSDDGWRVELPRVALVASGRRAPVAD